MQRNAIDTLNVALMLLLVLTSFRVGLSQSSNLIARFELPQRETIIRQSIERCADWLTAHSVSGYLEPSEGADKKTVTAIAWKDPTLVPEQPNLLAGYLITDTLWASVALRDLRPPLAKELWTSLEGLGHASNGLHEVLWSKVDGIRHRSADLDRVHGASVGKLYLPNDQTVDLRVFNMQADPAYTVGHPKLFAEHAAYQALHEFWHGDLGRARDRIRRFFQSNLETASEQTIFWDNERRILVDHVNIDEWRVMKRSHSSCRIFAFKLAVVAYAAKVLNLEREFRSELFGIQQRLWECQLNDGGIAHFAKISTDGQLIACKDATGEATSITILCHTVQPSVQQ